MARMGPRQSGCLHSELHLLCTRRQKVCMRSIAKVAFIAAITTTAARPAAAVVVIRMLEFAANPGATIEVAVTLETDGQDVAGTQNDIELHPPLSFANANGGPDCNAEPTIDKDGTAFAFVPCETEGCERVRALVLSLRNVDPIPDGSILYRCRIMIDETAEPDSYPLPVLAVGASDPLGNTVPVSGLAGSIFVGGPAGARVVIGDVSVAAGEIADVPVQLESGNVQVLDVELRYGPETPVVIGDENRPPCAVVGSGRSAIFSFRPQGCSADEGTCTAIGARVTADGIELPTGEPLFTCAFRPRPTVDPGPYAIGCGGAFASDAGGHAVVVACSGAQLQVVGDEPTRTPTPEDEPTVTAATFTATIAAQRTATPPASGSDNDDSCAVIPAGESAPASALLWPLAAWWILRRRRC